MTVPPAATPCRALSIKQPWAHHIVCGRKDVENRSWNTAYRGTLLVHAARSTAEDPDLIRRLDLPLGGIVGAVDVVECVTDHPSPWFFGPIGWVLANPRPLPFTLCRGRLGLFTPDLTARQWETIAVALTAGAGAS
ncbi:ASCH domain-containing protein [Roseospira marina]|uniref:ASCH domain-containing protein n=1 Tax=Roseospira marina TaxID=140057 RepID=A0A5M6I6Z9_9PROT|nr:ASCH domain-containing protein [Roseospira marina]KAA5604040.1 ASCH domain-containing protein [Roseospira marina]MBB4315834.1 hypothetical protein [Roseospira marina]MBB5089026.1 hypothetical protein [Roseospira marina]